MRSRPPLAVAMVTATVTATALAIAPAAAQPSRTPASSGAAATFAVPALAPVALTTADGVDPGAAAGRSLNLPEGWTAEIWANVPGARMAAWTPDGRLVVSTGQAGTLTLLSPTSEGSGPAVATLAGGLQFPQGVAFTQQDGHGVLVVGEETRIVAWDYAAGAVTNRRVLVDGLPTGGHRAKMVAVQDGQVVYNIGSGTNSDPNDRTTTPPRATIGQVGLDGSGNRVIATGVRNGMGLSFAPDGTLFSAINQADNQPYPYHDSTGQYGQIVREYVNENPVDQVSRVTLDTELGWPYCMPEVADSGDLTDLGYVEQPVNNPDGEVFDCSTVDRTQLGLPAHSAPIGFVFTHGSKLPQPLAHGALITAHGSWNRQPPREPYVAYSAWDEDSRTLTEAEAIVTGFQNPDGTRWGRSVDAVAGPDGSLYVTDDAAGLVYRLTPGD